MLCIKCGELSSGPTCRACLEKERHNKIKADLKELEKQGEVEIIWDGNGGFTAKYLNWKGWIKEAYLKLIAEMNNSYNIFHANNPETDLGQEDYEAATERILEIEDCCNLILKKLNGVIPEKERRRYREKYYHKSAINKE